MFLVPRGSEFSRWGTGNTSLPGHDRSSFQLRSALLRPVAILTRSIRRRTGYGLAETRPVFVHLQKTGGRSIGRMLKTAYWGHPILWVGADKLDMPQRELERYSVFRGHIPPSFAARVPNAFPFTFLRDPEDCLLSMYFYGRQRGRDLKSLRECLATDFADNLMTRALAGDADADAAIEALRKMKFVGLTERFDEDTSRLFHMLGKGHIEPVVWKPTRARVYLEDLSSEVRARLKELTVLDRKVYDWALKQR